MVDIGLAGEFRVVIENSENEVIKDYGYQKNLLLDNALVKYRSGSDAINGFCVVGTGNSTPVPTQTTLDLPIAIARSTDGGGSNYTYEDKGDFLYRMWDESVYIFNGLGDVNISEVGLTHSNSLTDLSTRALIKDESGIPVSISVKTGEILKIYYKLHKVVDVRDKNYVINMLDGDGGSVAYNCTVRPIMVGDIDHYYVPQGLSQMNENFGSILISSGELSAMTSKPSEGTTLDGSRVVLGSPSSEGRKIIFNLGINDANHNIRTVTVSNSSRITAFTYQIRYGTVEGDNPIYKNSNYQLTLNFIMNFSRFEGEL